MKRYISLFKCAIQEAIAYRSAYFTNVLANFIVYYVIFQVWRAIYSGSSSIAGYSLKNMQTYLVISMIINAFMSGVSEFRLSRQIRMGNIAMEILRPISYQKANLAMALGSGTMEGLLAIVMTVFMTMGMNIKIFPDDSYTFGISLISLFMAYMIKFIIAYTFSLLCFWTTSAGGVVWVRRVLCDFFSGALIPLSFFPLWLKNIAFVLPFQGMTNIPASIIIGKIRGTQAIFMILFQIGWFIVLWFLALSVWKIAMRKVTVNGG